VADLSFSILEGEANSDADDSLSGLLPCVTKTFTCLPLSGLEDYEAALRAFGCLMSVIDAGSRVP